MRHSLLRRSSAPAQLYGLPPLREVAAAHGVFPKKSLGQNFLFDLNLTSRIARAAGPLAQAAIVEIGPGPGGLTRALLAEGAKKVIAIERDARCFPALAAIASHYPGRLQIVQGNALETGIAALLDGEGPVRVCSNLPYNIATLLLIAWLQTEPWPPWFDRLILMFQREVAKRIVASPAGRASYGRLSVLANWRCDTRILFDVPASAFVPPPKVRSSLVELVPKARPADCSAKLLAELTQAAFGQRRKMLRQSLKALLGEEAPVLLSRANINPELRAEDIGVEEFASMARVLDVLRREAASVRLLR